MLTELLKQVGKKCDTYLNDGTYLGCIYPVYFLYPQIPHYQLKYTDKKLNYIYGMECINNHCIEINKDDLKSGDMIAAKFKDELHFAIYYEFNKIIHVFGGELKIDKLSLFKNYRCFRVV